MGGEPERVSFWGKIKLNSASLSFSSAPLPIWTPQCTWPLPDRNRTWDKACGGQRREKKNKLSGSEHPASTPPSQVRAFPCGFTHDFSSLASSHKAQGEDFSPERGLCSCPGHNPALPTSLAPGEGQGVKQLLEKLGQAEGPCGPRRGAGTELSAKRRRFPSAPHNSRCTN